MKADIKSILKALPARVAWNDIAQPEHIDRRVLAVNHILGDIIGVSEEYVEWCPNNEPPTASEKLLWWWVVRPDLGAAIAHEASQEVREAIVDYIETSVSS